MHYPCEEENCMFVVFSDELQLHLHYLSKHPNTNRKNYNKKSITLNMQQKAKPLNKYVSTTVSSVIRDFDDHFNETFWDGIIEIVSETPTKSNESLSTLAKTLATQLKINGVNLNDVKNISEIDLFSVTDKHNIEEPIKNIPSEHEEWIEYYFKSHLKLDGDAKFKEVVLSESNICRMNKFLSQIHGDLTDCNDDNVHVNNININRASHLFDDLSGVLKQFRGVSEDLIKDDLLITSHIPGELSTVYLEIIRSFNNSYKEILDDCTSSPDNTSRIFSLVKNHITSLFFLFYNVQINKSDVNCSKKQVSLDYLKLLDVTKLKIGPNGLLFALAIARLSFLSNKFIVKNGFEALINDMKSIYSINASKNKRLYSLTETLKTRGSDSISCAALNPNSDLNKIISKRNHDKRNIIKLPRKNPTSKKKDFGTLTGSDAKNMSEDLRCKDTTLSFDDADTSTYHPSSDETRINGLSSELASNDVIKFINDPRVSFDMHVNTGNFYGLMYDVIGDLLKSNIAKYNATSTIYTLRETVKSKLNKLLLSHEKSFTHLGEFVSMKRLESLQALEPEFYRLVKDIKSGGDPSILIKSWTTRCNNALRHTKVEHLEVMHYYLRHSLDTSMALCNDEEFPSLVKKNDKYDDYTTTMNYASVVGVPTMKNKIRILNEADFPTLKQTMRRKR